MVEFLKKYDMDVTSQDAFKILHNEFALNRSQYYHLRRKITQTMPISDFLEEIKEKNYLVSYEEWP